MNRSFAASSPADRQQVRVEWFYVRYRTVAWTVLLLLIALVAVVGWWLLRESAPNAERAARAIAKAETLVSQARGTSPGRANLELADHHLTQAKDLARDQSFGLAIDEAAAAEGLARMALTSGMQSGPPGVRVARVEGDVRVKRAGQFIWEEATEQVVLSQGDQVRTGGDGTAQLLYFDGTVMTISAGTLLEIQELYRDEARRQQRVSERLAWGRLTAKTEDNPNIDTIHRVSTADASVLAGSATEFEIGHPRDGGKSEIVALRGGLSLRDGARQTPIPENTRVEVAKGEIVARQTLFDAPRLMSPPDQRTFPADGGARISASWIALEGAERYRVQLSDRSMFSRMLADLDHTGSSSLTFPPLGPGTYYWRVAAVGDNDRLGRWSEVRKFRLSGGDFADPEDSTPPELDLFEVLVVGSNAIISGRTEPDAALWIDGERVDVAEDGRFNWLIKLRRDGKNDIVFLAQDAAGNEVRRVGHAYVDAY